MTTVSTHTASVQYLRVASHDQENPDPQKEHICHRVPRKPRHSIAELSFGDIPVSCADDICSSCCRVLWSCDCTDAACAWDRASSDSRASRACSTADLAALLVTSCLRNSKISACACAQLAAAHYCQNPASTYLKPNCHQPGLPSELCVADVCRRGGTGHLAES